MDSSSSSSNPRWIHDVFISFRGEDTRKTFVSHLYAALTNAGINTYTDSQLHKGVELGPELSQGIEWSHISIVVFSKRYTESCWCLNELKKIMECYRTHGHVVVPVFYDVDPSVVRYQKGDFGKALLSTAKKIYFHSGEERLEYVLSRWTSALTEAANLAGWDVNNCRNEGELMQQIVADVLEKLDSAFLPITGLEKLNCGGRFGKTNAANYAHFEYYLVIEFIVTQPSKVCMMGIWGMGGLGKTTTAKAVYNQIHRKFEDKSFIENIREVYEKYSTGIIHLQQQLLSDILNSKEIIHSIASGTSTIERRLQGKRALVVLDDVTTIKQLHALFRNLTFFWLRKCFNCYNQGCAHT
ncbi:putative TIR domain, P-loop containing nucleoside triphosphate hydrolase [Medicago truncatula]|uniref:Putative TIR domain, P-loop containing nucleoside triphosphate hydrolase n=1 Tax=Medicago truncatula TaxID=3880 RepID=A0A396GCH9_MEDTR|nr:putative TIR domain, P-loop containing nucleoside triphosphate hydrolase [Medicago truncatula]